MEKKNKPIAVITADIINSKRISSENWMKPLKKELETLGKTPSYWEIYRGDSLQVRIDDVGSALEKAIRLKAIMKLHKPLDIRMAIGIGNITYDPGKITESNGTAFINSGEKFELLKKQKQSLAIKSGLDDLDEEINLYIKLALIAMDQWTVNSAEIIKIAMENPGKSQEELGQLLGIKQNAVSRRLKRAYYEELMALIDRFRTKMKERYGDTR